MAIKKTPLNKLKSKTGLKADNHINHKKSAKLRTRNNTSSKLAVKRDRLIRKKKLGLFYQITFSIVLILFLALSYFLTIISIDSKEVSLISSQIESALKGRVSDDVTVGKTRVGLTRYGIFKITIDNLKITTRSINSQKNHSFFAPKIEAEISLLDALMLNFQPKKIKVISPIIITNAMDGKDLDVEGDHSIDVSFLTKLLTSIEKGNILLKNIEIENAQLLLRGKDENTNFLLKKLFVETSVKDGRGYLISKNTIALSEIDSEINSAVNKEIEFSLNCSLSEQRIPRCGVALENFVVASVANLHPMLKQLNNIDGSFDAKASFSLSKNGELSNVDFAILSKKGSFEFLNFFKQKMDFEDLSIAGLYDHKSQILSLAKIDAHFNYDDVSAIKEGTTDLEEFPKTILNMSLLISNFGNQKGVDLGFNINLEDVPVVEIDKFWPVSLNKKGIRKWVVSHVNAGVIDHAQAKFSLTKLPSQRDNKIFHLNEIEAKASFSGAGIDYSYNFPTIDNLHGEAEFDMQGMKIALASGRVLKSNIFDSEVLIDDFRDPNARLKIRGHSRGHAADLLKHAGYNSPFSSEIERYFNGKSMNSFQVEIPLTKKITLEDTYVFAKSKITDLKNDYVNGDLVVVSEKKSGVNDFVTKMTLTDTDFTTKVFDIMKNKGVTSELNFIASIQGQNQLQLHNLYLSKKDLNGKKALISGDLAFDLKPFVPTEINLKNRFFGKNNYDFSYQYDKIISKKKISLKGSQFNLGALIANKLPFGAAESKDSSGSIEMNVISNSVEMLYDKSIKNLYLFLNCQSGICHKVTAKARYSQDQFIHFSSSKESNLGAAKITGHISDIGYLAEAFGISHAVSPADADVEIINKFENGKAICQGDVILKNGVTIYDNAMVKRLAKDDLFSQVKDKIFSNDKTVFNAVKIKFAMNKGMLNLESLIANNYKIGITAKGNIDLVHGFYDIKGMIVPGFIVNNLFGIGKVPVVGTVVRKLLTGGKGGGVFGIRYAYSKAEGDKEARFKTNKVSSFVPTTIKNLFDLI